MYRWLCTNLGGIRPRQRPPTKLVDGIGEEDHGDRRNARGRRTRVWLGGRVVDDGDDDEAHGHEQGGHPERRFASPHLREKEDVDTDRDELFCAEEAGDQQGPTAVVANDQLEELRAEVCQCRHAGALLAAEDEEGQAEPVAVCWLEQLALLQAFGRAQLFGETDLDFVEFGLDVGSYRGCILVCDWRLTVK